MLTFLIKYHLIYLKYQCHCCDKRDLSLIFKIEVYGWQSDLRSTIDFSRSRASLLNLKQQPTSLRDECLAGSGILQVNYSLEWAARRGVGWHAHHWGTPAPRRHLSPYASSAGVKLRGTYVHTYVNTFACMYAAILVISLCHRLDVLRNPQFSRHRWL
jgi:hypothetical protein